MPTPRKTTPAKKIDVNIAVERRLIDSKIVLPRGAALSHRFLKIIVYAVILGGLAGSGLVFYLKISQSESESDSYIPEITIPNEISESAEAATPSTTAEETLPKPAPVQVVEILDTPTGTLNVRKGPGTNFAKITQIQPGEAFILISTDEKSGWYEIKLADGSTGWVTGQYAAVR